LLSIGTKIVSTLVNEVLILKGHGLHLGDSNCKGPAKFEKQVTYDTFR